jgi:hypothetical protein
MFLIADFWQWLYYICKDLQILTLAAMLVTAGVTYYFLWRQMKATKEQAELTRKQAEATELQGNISSQMLKDSIKPFPVLLSYSRNQNVVMVRNDNSYIFDMRLICKIKSGFMRLYSIGFLPSMDKILSAKLKEALDGHDFHIGLCNAILINDQERSFRITTDKPEVFIYICVIFTDYSNNLYASIVEICMNSDQRQSYYEQRIFEPIRVDYNITQQEFIDYHDMVDPDQLLRLFAGKFIASYSNIFTVHLIDEDGNILS